MYRKLKTCLAAGLIFAAPVIGQQHQEEDSAAAGVDTSTTDQVPAPADRIVQSLTNTELRSLVSDTLARNPGVARALALARAADNRAPQVRTLPDPVAGLTAWLKSPETRTGPQLLTLNWTQALPWLSKLDLKEQAAILEASALDFKVEATRLELVTTVRRLYYELAFLARYKEITLDFLDHLQQHEEISQSRYATGIGASQDVVKIQAEITLAENLLLDLDQRRIDLEAEINHLRDRPASTVILPAVLPAGDEVGLDFGRLRELARQSRPEVAAVDARIAATEARVKLAEKEYRPDFTVGLTYTFVDPREDTAGIVTPPAGNGDDIFGIRGAVSVPIWRKKLKTGVEEANELELSAREAKRDVLAGIEAAVGNLMQRIPLTWQQLRLLEDILILQAEEAVQSAQSGYVTGAFNALDLLDAEHVLFKAETAIARAQADYAIRLTQLEGEVGGPLQQHSTTESSES
ncbi:MAG: TolC family protein [Thermoanaerobaculia bacterium]